MGYRKKGIWLLAPGLAGFLLFYLLPFIYSFYYAVIENAFTKRYVGLANFISIIGNRYFRIATKNTFQFTCIGVPILVVISFILAVLVISAKNKSSMSRAAFVLPILLPSAAVVMIWQVFFGSGSAFMEYFASGLKIVTGSFWQKVPVFIFFFWKNAGFNMILFMAGLASIPGELYEVCEIEGASSFQKHCYITIPLLLPTTFFVFIISTVNSFKIFKETFLLYGAYPSESLYLVQHYMNNHFQKLNYLPAAYTDFIYAAIGEELGLMGTLGVIGLFAFWVSQARMVYYRVPDGFKSSLTWGVTLTVILPLVINVAGVTKLIPLTGMPLPFVSYGGTSLLTMWSRVGIMLRLDKESRDREERP